MMRPSREPAGAREQAAAVLAARRVLVTGFAEAPLETAALACDLAEAVGAAVDPGGMDCAQVTGPTIARVGSVTADAEELRDRADLVVLWFCDPRAIDPSFMDRHVAPPTRAGRPRSVIAVGPRRGPAHDHLAVARADAFDLARLLHAAVVGVTVPTAAAPLDAAVAALHAASAAADCVAFVTCHDDPTGLEPWSLAGLVQALAHRKPAFEVPLAGGGDAAAVCTWRYGAAGAIARADRAGAAFLPAECDPLRLIARGEVDCVVAVGPLPEAIDAAIGARGDRLTAVRTEPQEVAALLAAVRTQAAAGGRQ